MTSAVGNMGATGVASHKDLKLSNLVVDKRLVCHGMFVNNFQAKTVDCANGYSQNGSRILSATPGGVCIVGANTPQQPGTDMVIVGSDASPGCAAGSNDTLVGDHTANKYVLGQNNVVVGASAMSNANASENNTIIGSQSALSVAHGVSNVLIGYLADAAPFGGYNVVIGAQTGGRHCDSLNTVVGNGASGNMDSATGTGCLSLGFQAETHSDHSIGIDQTLTLHDTSGAVSKYIEVWIGSTHYKLPLYAFS
jgi:hypothetical protein